jgi:hypothetical protein
MSKEQAPVKRPRGRPRIHVGESVVLSIRVSEHQRDLIRGLLAAIRCAERRVHSPEGDILLEALEQRLRGLANQMPVRPEHGAKPRKKSWIGESGDLN